MFLPGNESVERAILANSDDEINKTKDEWTDFTELFHDLSFEKGMKVPIMDKLHWYYDNTIYLVLSKARNNTVLVWTGLEKHQVKNFPASKLQEFQPPPKVPLPPAPGQKGSMFKDVETALSKSKSIRQRAYAYGRILERTDLPQLPSTARLAAALSQAPAIWPHWEH